MWVLITRVSFFSFSMQGSVLSCLRSFKQFPSRFLQLISSPRLYYHLECFFKSSTTSHQNYRSLEVLPQTFEECTLDFIGAKTCGRWEGRYFRRQGRLFEGSLRNGVIKSIGHETACTCFFRVLCSDRAQTPTSLNCLETLKVVVNISNSRVWRMMILPICCSKNWTVCCPYF